MRATLGLLLVLVGCTTRNPLYCDQDSDCEDPSRPFCDLNGEYPESGNIGHTCSPTPANCPAERCGCVPGTATCSSDLQVTCNPDGMSATRTACALGCATGEPRCLTFQPTNIGTSVLADAGNEPDIVIPAGVRIDTTACTVTDAGGTLVAIRSVMVSQTAAPICVLLARSFSIANASVTGVHPLGLVAAGPIELRGALDARSSSSFAGPGAQEGPAGCLGGSKPDSGSVSDGGGGAGNATAGGKGGSNTTANAPGGEAVTSFAPLAGGCRGGSIYSLMFVLYNGGGGGGAVQLVSLQSIELRADGFINVSGGGGAPYAGGGSGGVVILEAPQVTLDGATTGIVANGGAGGGCNVAGQDGGTTTASALGGSGCNERGGNGGSGLAAAMDAVTCGSTCFQARFGGGGGAVGRLRVATKVGGYEHSNSPVISALVSEATLTPQ